MLIIKYPNYRSFICCQFVEVCVLKYLFQVEIKKNKITHNFCVENVSLKMDLLKIKIPNELIKPKNLLYCRANPSWSLGCRSAIFHKLGRILNRVWAAGWTPLIYLIKNHSIHFSYRNCHSNKFPNKVPSKKINSDAEIFKLITFKKEIEMT
jgi:hypothetical protein